MILRVFLTAALLASAALMAEAGRSRGRGRGAAKRAELPEDIQISTSEESKRKGKFFNLFNVVTFENGPCRSTSSISGNTNRNGTCLTSTECQDRGGAINGNCAAGFGACCVFVLNENSGTITQNCTYIQNPGYPSALTATNAISYTVQKCSDDVCSVRLDFETFSIQGPSDTTEATGGVCTDTFIASVNSGITYPTICGDNTGSHMYLDLGNEASNTAQLAFTFTGSTNRQYEIKVTQVECNNPNRPYDTGCVQYHVGSTGRITNFNFQATETTTHLQDQNYNICIRQEEGMGCIEYQVCPDIVPSTNVFSLTVHGLQQANTVPLTSGLNDNNCNEDHIVIDGGMNTCSCGSNTPIRSRFCGIFFSAFNGAMANSPVCDCSPPFAVGVFTNLQADGASTTNGNADVQSKGFCLEYRQLPC